MSLVTDKFVFAHLPKTGGQHIRKVISELGIPAREVCKHHAAPAAIPKAGINLPILVSIRHPVAWYQSRWYHRVRIGWMPMHPVDWECASNDFNKFVEHMLDYDPHGRLTSLTKLFLRKTPKKQVEYIIKNENLQDELYLFLRKIGYDTTREQINNVPRTNTSGVAGRSAKDVAIYKPETLERLLDHESWLINEFYDGITDPNALTDQFVV